MYTCLRPGVRDRAPMLPEVAQNGRDAASFLRLVCARWPPLPNSGENAHYPIITNPPRTSKKLGVKYLNRTLPKYRFEIDA